MLRLLIVLLSFICLTSRAHAEFRIVRHVPGVIYTIISGTDDAVPVGNGTDWDRLVLTDCPSGGISYNTTTRAFGCTSIAGGGFAHALLSATHTDTLVGSPVLGNIIYANSTPAWTKLVGNSTTGKLFLSQTGTGAVSAAPAWSLLIDSDIPDTITISGADNVTLASLANGADDTTLVSNGTNILSTALADSDAAGQALRYDTTGNTFSAGQVVPGAVLAGSATIDFTDVVATCETSGTTVTVTGAADGDVCNVGFVAAVAGARQTYDCWVSSANTVSVRHCEGVTEAIDPASSTFKVIVMQQ